MGSYIVLAKFTEQGVRGVKDSSKRRAAARELLASVGGEIKQAYLTMGKYDLVIVAEAPSDEVMATFMLKMAAIGNLSTQTLRAFDEAATDELTASL